MNTDASSTCKILEFCSLRLRDLADTPTLRPYEKREPATALREWLMLFVDFLDAKYGMAEAMDTLIGGPEPLYSRTPHRLDVPIKALVAGGVASGVFRDDLEPHDLLRALSGVAHVRPSENWKRSAVQMVDILLKGMQSIP